ncbi:hypothetical protein PoB_004963200 [Plakobranchus ocellatus]|uniref:Uncharacterized protein n=1 Tax=Plakobranchus ocellatus TaxID=259542 RepID=A0AAV4BUW9_9GAST|nr:hypothetical protein PoB_004963200 [Plakobranchus ocellatus]
MSQTRLTQGFGEKINGTSKSALGLPRDVDLPLDGSPSGHMSASGRRVSLRTLGQGCTQQFRTVPPQVVFSGWPTVAIQASLSDNWHTSAQRPLRSGTHGHHVVALTSGSVVE